MELLAVELLALLQLGDELLLLVEVQLQLGALLPAALIPLSPVLQLQPQFVRGLQAETSTQAVATT